MPDRTPRFQDVVGVEIVDASENGSLVRLALGPEHRNANGAVHGGVLFTLADVALGSGIHKRVGKRCTTAEMKINYLKVAKGETLTARSRVLRAGRRLAVARAEVLCGEDLVAQALATFAILE